MNTVPGRRRATLLVPDEQRLVRPEACKPRDHRRVVAEPTVAVKLAEVLAEHLDVVAALRPLGVACHAHRVPRRDRVVHLVHLRRALAHQQRRLLGELRLLRRAGRGHPQLPLDLLKHGAVH